MYANAAQWVWIVGENDTVVDTYLVSGREGVPAPGIYEVFSKSETASAGHDNITPCRCTTVREETSLERSFSFT